MKIYPKGNLTACLVVAAALAAAPCAARAGELYGPVNLLKTLPTPFGAPGPKPAAASPSPDSERASPEMMMPTGQGSLSLTIAPAIGSARPAPVKPIAIGDRLSALTHRSLAERLVQSRLYLPGRLVISRTAEFTIKGRPGSFVALAMADKDSGARPIYGHPLRLGPDRKVVSVGQIPEDGILHLTIETPIEGDLIGQNLFFEASVWSRPDFADLEIATPVTSEGQTGVKNGVLVAGEPPRSTGLKIVPAASMPVQQLSKPGATLESGQP